MAHTHHHMPRSVDRSVFSGSTGIALFLAAAHACGLPSVNSQFVEHLLDVEHTALRRDADRLQFKARRRVLTHDGLLGRSAALSWATRLLGQVAAAPELDALAAAAFRAHLSAVSVRSKTDASDVELLDGIAGAVLARLGSRTGAMTGRDHDDLAEASARLATAVERWPYGRRPQRLNTVAAAHGLAGAALALGQAGVELGHTGFCESAYHASAQALATALKRLTDEKADGADGFAGSWCNGAVGVLACTLAYASTPELGVNWRQLLEHLCQQRTPPTDTVCCGSFGRLSLAAELRQSHSPALASDAARLLSGRDGEQMALDRLRLGERDWFLAPGLYQGIAGVGFVWLQIANVRALPSLLRFERMKHVSA
jgi:lantibiotic modifying enzyme